MEGNRNYGHIILRIDEVRLKRGISKSKLAQRVEIQRGQLNKYSSDKMQRVDLDILARICSVLNCDIKDIMEYVPDTK